MSEVLLRAAEPAEVNAVLAFWQIAAEDAHRPVDTPEALTALLRRDPEALILAVDDDKIIASIVAGWDGWRCHLYRLAVRPDRRGEGLGKAMIAAAEERFRLLGGTRADAMVLDDNELAHGVWAASGYRRQPEWSRWVKPLT